MFEYPIILGRIFLWISADSNYNLLEVIHVIVWNENLETGNYVIDAQHKEIFCRFNDFQPACKQGKGLYELYELYELSNLFTFLDEYVR